MKWKDKINRKYMQVSLYVVLTAIVIYCLSLVAKNAPSIAQDIMARFRWLMRVITPIIYGFVLAYLLAPVVVFFEKNYGRIKFVKKKRSQRMLAVTTSVVLLIIVFAGLISLLVFSVTDQLRLANFDDIIKLGQDYLSNLNAFIQSLSIKLGTLDIQSTEIKEYINSATIYIVSGIKSFADSVVSSLSNISRYLTTIIFSLIIGIYFMIDGKMIIEYIKKVLAALFSIPANKKVRGIIHDIDEVFSGYIRGQLTDAFVMMILISLVLSIAGVKFAFVIGILAGIGNIIPYFGPVVAYVGATLVCVINGQYKTLIFALIALLIIQTIDANIIGPKLLSRSIQIHPLLIIISLIFGSAMGGLLGMVLAVPIGAYIKVVFVRFVDHRLQRKEEMIKENEIDKN